MTDALDLPLAVYRRRAPEPIVVEIERGDPSLVVRFRVPSAEDSALIEARSREAILNLMQGRGAEKRYGLTNTAAMDETTLAGLSSFIVAVESAALLITDWNYGVADADGQAAKVTLSPETIADLFRGRPLARAGWTLQYETVSPLERAEGNVSAASPDTTSATAANTAEAAPAQDPAAAGAA